MSTSIEDLFDHNRLWAAQMERERPGFFSKLRNQQSPKYMWIGCSDSRVPANQITGLEPGEVFVHRNVANLVVHSDLNALSTIQFAVERLQVEHVMVVGHYGCSGVRAALEGLPCHFVESLDPTGPTSGSLHAGLRAFGPEIDATLVNARRHGAGDDGDDR